MSYYFTLTDFLSTTKDLNDRTPTHYPLPVYLDAGNIIAGSQEDIFVSEEYFNIWDASYNNNAHTQLAHFMAKTQVYRLALELLMDQALIAANNDNEALSNAIEYAFTKSKTGIPQMVDKENALHNTVTGDLKFPVLEHLSHEELAENYFLFFEKIDCPRLRGAYGVHNIIKLDRGPFYKNFDGFKEHNTVSIRFDKLLETCKRMAITANENIEDCVMNGQRRAKEQNLTTATAQLNAYLQSDRQQYLRCQEIDGLLSLMQDTPTCLRFDIFNVMEHEAMKQVYAENLLTTDEGRNLIAHTTHIKNAVAHNAAGHISDCLQKMIEETLAPDATYNGAAKGFLEASEHRQTEAETISGLS